MTERRKQDRREQDYLMTDEQVAHKAKVSTNTVRYWRQIGLLPFVKIGKYPRVWYSVFLKVFGKPLPHGVGGAVTMQIADGDIRRQL